MPLNPGQYYTIEDAVTECFPHLGNAGDVAESSDLAKVMRTLGGDCSRLMKHSEIVKAKIERVKVPVYGRSYPYMWAYPAYVVDFVFKQTDGISAHYKAFGDNPLDSLIGGLVK